MYSKIAILFIVLFSILFRLSILSMYDKNQNVTTYDAFGYYAYLPAIFIYKDYKELKWIDEIHKRYKVLGDKLYQAHKVENGNFVFKYYCGVAIMQAPFFFIANSIAERIGYPKDGFSSPYQMAIIFSSIFYFLLGLIFLRKSLLHYFEESVVFLVLICITVATNLPQYVSIECGMSHSYLFFVYCLIIYLTIRVHNSPSKLNTFFLGLFCGLAIATRPTEAICILIPIFWKVSFYLNGQSKFAYLKQNIQFVLLPIVGGTLVLFFQIFYWYLSTGDYIYNVGSKWVFLNPYFKVLFGFEKGWFVYTPIAIFFMLGLFKLGGNAFKKSILTFTLINIWIIISWFDWRYGASYSTRALSHSYPVFALSLASLLTFLKGKKTYLLFVVIMIAMAAINIFQLYQYNNEVLHFNDMNRKYYKQIFLNPNPVPLDFSLLDTKDWVKKSKIDEVRNLFASTGSIKLSSGEEIRNMVITNETRGQTIKTKIDINAMHAYWGGELLVKLFSSDTLIKSQSFRLKTPLSSFGEINRYEFYTDIPLSCINCTLSYTVENSKVSNVFVEHLAIGHVKLKQD